MARLTGCAGTALVVVGCLALSSCVYHPSLPKGWEKPAAGRGSACPDITGRYSVTFVCEDGKEIRNAVALLGKTPDDRLTHVAIAQPAPGTIEVTALQDDIAVFSRTLTLGAQDFSCADGWIRVKSSDGGVVGGTMVAAVGGGRQTDAFARAGNHLLVKSSGSGAGVAIVPIPFPFAYSLSSWCRSPAAE